MAKTMFCFNKISAKNESQTIISITQKHHYKTRLAAQQNYFQPRKRTEVGKKTFFYIGLNGVTEVLISRIYIK